MIPLPPPVNYLIAKDSELPPITASMFEYVLGANGLFLRLQREGFTATAPLAECPIRGLAPVAPHFQLHYPLVPAFLSLQMLQLARQAAPQEILLHFYFQQGRWQLRIPQQERRVESVLRLESSPEIVMEIHSHHHLPAYFSAQDDTDESGCKIYGVLGTIFTRPILRLRVGLYNRQFWEIPTNWAFEESCWTSDTVSPDLKL